MTTTRPYALLVMGLVGAAACSAAPRETAPAAPSRREEQVVRMSGTFDMQMQLNRTAAIFGDTLAADPVRAWAHLPAVFEALALPVNRADVATQELAVVALQPRRIEGQRLSLFLDCGRSPTGGDLADSYQVYFWMSARVLARPGGSRVETLVQANARPRDRGGEPVPCNTRGRLERRVVELLRERLAGRTE